MYKLKESTEIILVFDDYTDEYSLKEQERSDKAGLIASYQKSSRVPVKHQNQISPTEKVHQISYTWNHT